MQSSAPAPGTPSPWDSALGVIEDSISQCTFLQMTYTAETPHADGSAAPGARPRLRQPRRRDPHATSPAPTTTGWLEDRCPVVSKRPLHSLSAAKMSPHIRICPEPVLADHAPSLPAAGSHCPAREDSAPHCGTEFILGHGKPGVWPRNCSMTPQQQRELFNTILCNKTLFNCCYGTRLHNQSPNLLITY
jgi:hypothetical protein